MEHRKTQDKETKVQLQYRHYVSQKIAKHFGVPVGKLKEGTEMDQEVLYYPDLSSEFRGLIYGGHYDKLELKNLISMKYLKKHGGFYDSLVNAESQVPKSRVGDVLLAVHWPGSIFNVWVFYRAEGDYDGLGGIFVKDEHDAFVFEPLENFLQHNYPRQDEG